MTHENTRYQLLILQDCGQGRRNFKTEGERLRENGLLIYGPIDKDSHFFIFPDGTFLRGVPPKITDFKKVRNAAGKAFTDWEKAPLT